MTKEALKQAADKQHWNEDEWRRNNWRCGHGWLRGEQCEICNAAKEPPSECSVKYRKKPVVIEATQWFKMGDHPAVFYNHNSVPTIKTLEGEMFVRSGDFIITGVRGEHYPCKPDIFEMTYERAEDDDIQDYKIKGTTA